MSDIKKVIGNVFEEIATGLETGAFGTRPRIAVTTLGSVQDIIDDLTFNRIVYIGYDNLTDFQKECLKKCMFVSIEFYFNNKELYEQTMNLKSYSVGDISVTSEINEQIITKIKKYKIPYLAYSNLKKTGLMRRGFKW